MIYIISVKETEKFIEAREVEEAIENDFGLPVRGHVVDIAPERFYDPKRGQYLSTSILKELLYNLSPDAVKAVGIVSFDLFIPVLTFVFGEAQLDGKVAVVSTARLDQSFYGLPANQPLLQRRLIKEIKHELGHTFGLLHCPQKPCVMSLATTVADVDRKSLTFCDVCKDEHGSARVSLLKTNPGHQ
jgi:archaemetzincin